MHPNPIYHSQDTATDIAFARDRAFGTLVLNGDLVPMVSHVPFLLAGDGSHADLHLVRSNPIARALNAPQPAMIAVNGPDGYISPDWYGIDHQVPTWNYVAVHLTGRLELLPQNALLPLLDRQSEAFESRLLPKPVWKTDKMPDAVMDRLMRMIVPCRLHIADIAATWKLAQNKPDAARLGAATGTQAAGFGLETGQLARIMRTPPEL
ncbi:FMN-binding negative transcriptional regulator [Mesobacterium sp. TK19101]|uniref:FMN-binding negative transcriptional regulator n=1 Tax=Mesobacterium hydrothermale TaxID=3111907 RepID=A0ABU6HK56_9RHOB|nr:FMN-binding negative transcriptional regulator [Mesobacterium sp. TK19101]MEC3862843.1 FMN-binding negative transcriptional regulator [Mesobacterium sp. TK19101]